MTNSYDANSTEPAGRPVILRDIAERCGVSLTTVSGALRDPSRYSAATTQRILAVAAELGYNPDAHTAARRMALKRCGQPAPHNHLIAVVVPFAYDDTRYFVDIFRSVSETFDARGYDLLFLKAAGFEGAIRIPPSFYRGDVDGILIVDGWLEFQPVLQQLRENPAFGVRPVVMVKGVITDECSLVKPDAEHGAAAMARHLLDLGHRHFLHFTPHKRAVFASHQDEIIPGFQRAVREAGLQESTSFSALELDATLWRLAFDTRNVRKLAVLGELSWPAHHWLPRYLRKHPEITSIIAPNDAYANIMAYLLRREGIRIPDDVSLVGFDDTIPLVDEQMRNILTTVRVDCSAMGKRASEILLDRITNRLDHNVKENIPTELIIRGSTAPASR